MRSIIVILLSSVVFAACSNCNTRAYGYITDDNSNKAIDSVKIRSYGALAGKIKDERVVYVDSNGYFETYFSSKSTAKCPVLKMEITRDGYYPVVTAEGLTGDTIYMKKIQP
ncbi:MAG: hypothetical protein R2800_04165 [Flavipsychrobacter sp.]